MIYVERQPKYRLATYRMRILPKFRRRLQALTKTDTGPH